MFIASTFLTDTMYILNSYAVLHDDFNKMRRRAFGEYVCACVSHYICVITTRRTETGVKKIIEEFSFIASKALYQW